MKKFSLAILCITAAFAVQAQTSDAETDAIVNLLGVQKKEAIAKMVPVSAKDSATFWKIYDDYLKKNKEVAKARIKLYEHTALSYGNMNN